MATGTDFVVKGAIDLRVMILVCESAHLRSAIRGVFANLVLFCSKDGREIICHDC